MIVIYNIFRFLYFNSIKLASNWSAKAKLWTDGRKKWQLHLQNNWKLSPHEKVVWMHCASLGEFEQGRPVIEKIKKQFPTTKILLTFFSPSGYEVRKKYEGADFILYLPEDSKVNAKAFLDLVNPMLAIFVKYEFWHFYLAELEKRKIETILISGIFRATQPFFQWWGGFYKQMLQKFNHVFVQDYESVALLTSINFKSKVSVCGDTRFDRVLEMAEYWTPVENVEQYINPRKKILVAGSTWKEDEVILAQWLEHQKNDWQLIIAPHEIDEKHIRELRQLFNNSILFSEFSNQTLQPINQNCMIINTIGHLSKIYKYATVCYIGGGFTKDGIHNTLEAAVYKKPLVTGPTIQKYREAIELKQTGALITITNAKELNVAIETLQSNNKGIVAGEYVNRNKGATEIILQYVQENRLLTNE